MSNATVNNYVKQACLSLEEQLPNESVRNAVPGVTKDNLSNIQQTAGSYVRYIVRFRKLEAAYDQMVHPQKRLLLRELLLAVMGRLLEMKHKLAGLECRDCHNFAEELVDFKLSPEDIEIPVPRFFMTDRMAAITENRGMLDSLNAKRLEASAPPQVAETMETAAAVRIIQTSERVRQAMVRVKYMRDIKLQAARESDFGGHEEQDIVGRAALKIQKVFRGYRTRQIFVLRRQEEDLFLRMVGPSSMPEAVLDGLNNSRLFKDDKEILRSCHERQRSTVRKEENEARRKILQKQFAEEYAEGLVAIRDKIKNNEGPELKEALQDDFRSWYLEAKKATGKYPLYKEIRRISRRELRRATFVLSVTSPSRFVPRHTFPEFPTEEFLQPGFRFQKPAAAPAEVPEAQPASDTAKPAGKETPAGKVKGKKGSEPPPEEAPPEQKETEYTKAVRSSLEKYSAAWLNRDESSNFAQRYDADVVRAEKRAEVEREVKAEVMEVLKDELKSLQASLEKGKGKGKGKGKKGKKEKKGKKDKKGKGKGKKEKDLTAGRTTESLFEELIQTGLAQRFEPTALSSFLGRDGTGDSDSPSYQDLKRAMVEYCILPLGFEGITETAPRVASVMLYGPQGCGKTMLVKAIATEAGANLFNISPSNTANEYKGKANVTKMIHTVFKVAKLKAPSVIYLRNAEMVFAKKVPKDDTTDPKRIKKDILKAVKGIKPSDRVLLLGTSDKPWDAELKAMVPCFDKMICVPKPDYAARQMLWGVGILRNLPHPQSLRNVHTGLLARYSEGITTAGIFRACERIISKRRLRLARSRPISDSEFLSDLQSKPEILDVEETQAFTDYTDKLPLSKKRNAMLASLPP